MMDRDTPKTAFVGGRLLQKVSGRECGLLALVLLIGLALRLIRLGTYSYWHDEALILLSTEHLDSVIKGEFVSNHPLLFTLLAGMWRRLGWGETEWTMRLLPVTLGMAGIGMMYVLGRRLYGPRAGLIAAFLLAISPFHILHSQDLKDYILLPFTGLVMVYAFLTAIDKNRPRYWVFYAVAAGIACHSEVFVVFWLVALNLWFLLFLRGRTNRLLGWFLANFAAFVMFSPFLGIMMDRSAKLLIEAKTWWIAAPTPWSVLFYLKTFAFGYSDTKPYVTIACAVFLVFCVTGIGLAWKHERRTALLLLMWFVVPMALVYTISHVTQSIFLTRALMPFGLPIFLWLGLALASFRAPAARGILLCVFVALAAIPLTQKYRGEYSSQEFPNRPGVHPPVPYKEAAHFILERWHEGDIVVHSGSDSWLPFQWYGVQGYSQFSVGQGFDFIKYILVGNPPATQRLDFQGYFIRELQPTVQDGNRVWFVFSDWERAYLPDNPLNCWRWMDAHFAETGYQDFGGLEIYLHERRHADQPIRCLRRDADDGLSATVTYEGFDAPYTKTRPDCGIRPTSPDSRRGNLTLRFADDSAIVPSERHANLAQTDRTRSVAFAVENRANRPISCLIECVPSDYLLDMASLDEEVPESDCWTVGPAHNPSPPPFAHDVSVASVHLTEKPIRSLEGQIAPPPGAYDTQVRLLGYPGDVSHGRARLRLDIAGRDLFEFFQMGSRSPLAWQWLVTAPLAVGDSAAPLPVRVVPRRAEGLAESWGDIGYLALKVARTSEDGPPQGVALPVWPGQVTIPAGETVAWSCALDSDTRRVDVWVYESGEGGRGYRIYRELF